jgi:hypothetical protein
MLNEFFDENENNDEDEDIPIVDKDLVTAIKNYNTNIIPVTPISNIDDNII